MTIRLYCRNNRENTYVINMRNKFPFHSIIIVSAILSESQANSARAQTNRRRFLFVNFTLPLHPLPRMFRGILFPAGAAYAFLHLFFTIFHTGAESFPHFDAVPDLFMFLLTLLHTTCYPRAVNIPFCLRAANFHLRILSLARIFFSAQHREEKIARNEHRDIAWRAYLFIIPSANSVSFYIF